MIILFQNILLLKDFLACNGCFGLFTKIIKRSGTSFCCIFSAWFFHKNVLYLMLHLWTKYQCHTFFLLTITQALSTGGVCLFLVYGSSSVLALQVAHLTKHTIFSGILQELLRKLYRSICNQKLNLLMVLDYSNKVKKNTLRAPFFLPNWTKTTVLQISGNSHWTVTILFCWFALNKKLLAIRKLGKFFWLPFWN